MTDRLYYADSYLTEFDAQVLEVQGNRVRLDRSAFYPTSGGQPFDTGYLGEARVTDVESVAGEVWHTVEGTLAGRRARAWPHRLAAPVRPYAAARGRAHDRQRCVPLF